MTLSDENEQWLTQFRSELAGLSKEESIERLTEQYARWNSRTTSGNSAYQREQAREMLLALAALRQELLVDDQDEPSSTRPTVSEPDREEGPPSVEGPDVSRGFKASLPKQSDVLQGHRSRYIAAGGLLGTVTLLVIGLTILMSGRDTVQFSDASWFVIDPMYSLKVIQGDYVFSDDALGLAFRASCDVTSEPLGRAHKVGNNAPIVGEGYAECTGWFVTEDTSDGQRGWLPASALQPVPAGDTVQSNIQPTSTPRATATPTSTPRATASPTSTPRATATPTSTPRATATPTSTPRATASPTSTPRATATPTSTPRATATPIASPSVPSQINATAGDRTISLSWAPSGGSGSSNVTYRVRYARFTSAAWRYEETNETRIVISELTNMVEYKIAVAAVVNGVTSDYSLEMTRIPIGPALAPSGVVVIPSTYPNSLAVQWTLRSPALEPIDGYFVECVDDQGTRKTTSTNSRTTRVRFNDLRAGVQYLCTVAAVTSYGNGLPSAPRGLITGGQSSPPTAVSVTPQNQSVRVEWSPPVQQIGVVQHYVVEYSSYQASPTQIQEKVVSWGDKTTISGLITGNIYQFRVTAVGSYGVGRPSDWVTATAGGLPGAPTGLSATAGNTQASLTWNAPSVTTGSVSYEIQYRSTNSPYSSWWTVTSSVTSTTINCLWDCTTYQFRVRVEDAIGVGSYSSTVNASGGPPGAPIGLSATAGTGQVSLTWNAPNVPGGSITFYEVEYKSGYSWIRSTSFDTSKIITDLISSTSYQFRVRAVNANGAGSYSSIVTATPAGLPGAPTGLSAEYIGISRVKLTWNAPSVTGGSITVYEVEYKGTGSWKLVSSSVTDKTVSGLTAGMTYQFRVRARTITGAGSYSSTVTATVDALPGAPTGLSATSGNGQVSLSWSAPAVTGGNISHYNVDYRVAGAPSWTSSDVTGTSTTINPLSNGTTYQFRIRAVNATGAGSYSSTVTVTPTGLPGAPTGLSATPGNGQVSLTWSAPAVTGGNISHYNVDYRVAGAPSWTSSDVTGTSTTINTLSNGTTYQFRIRAVSATGGGSYSSTVTATPAGLPGAPTGLTVIPNNSEVRLSWSVPDVTGGTITSYEVQYNSGSGWISVTSYETNKLIQYLTNATSYQFRVRALNANGAGIYSSIVIETVGHPPYAPSSLYSVGGSTPNSITLAWSPAGGAGLPIINYNVDHRVVGEISWTSLDVNGTSVTIGISEGDRVQFRVRAASVLGAGAYSQIGEVTTGAFPTNFTVNCGNQMATVSWVAPTGVSLRSNKPYSIGYNDHTNVGDLMSQMTNSTSITIYSLSPYMQYYFRVGAVSAGGMPSYNPDLISCTPALDSGVPSFIDGIQSSSPTSGTVVLDWAAPSSEGDAPVTDYVILRRDSSGWFWSIESDSVSTERSATLTGIETGKRHYFRVCAKNSYGWGECSTQTDIVPN